MNFKSKTIVGLALLFTLAVAFVSESEAGQVLRSQVPKATKNLSPVGRLDANKHMKLAIGLPLRNREQLTNLLEQIYDPSSPQFRHFLSADEFTAAFGPTADDLQSVINFAKSHHLKVDHTHPNRTLVDVSGKVADIESAFNIHLQKFKHPKENREFFAPDAEPSLNLKTPVLAISGLDSYTKPTPRLKHSTLALPQNISPRGGGGSTGGTYTGPYQGYQFRDAYVPDLFQEGQGQSVGIFELYGYSIQDIQAYQDESFIFPYVSVESVLIDGGTDDDSNALDQDGYLSYALETTADIEMAIAMAPSLSKVLVYIGPTPQDQPPLGTNYVQDATTTAQINDVLNRMATDNLAKQLSCSYGMDINLSTVQIFQQFAAQGQSFFLASGDSGAFTTAVNEPADDPYITIVGGTSLTTDTNGVYKSETVWLTPADPASGTPLQGSGGGVSTAYPIPSWQQGINMASSQGSTTMRNVPDVALVADNMTVTWGSEFFDPLDFPLGGTSLSAPLWAGFMALVNEQAALNNKPPIGFMNPVLYAIGKSANYQSCFHDITTGANTNNASPTKYRAVAGYDLCTGLGTISTNLFDALLSPPSETLRVTSPLGFTSFGKSGGPFSVTSQTFALANTGSTPLTWSINNSANWLTVSASGGTLNAGASTTVTVTLNANANSFLITRASGNVAFNNLTSGTTQNRQFDLYVGNGGFENGSLDYWSLVGDPTLSFALAADDAQIAGREALPGRPDPLFVHSGLYGGYLGQWPNNGTLSQTVPTVAGQPLLVSFSLTSVADDQGETTPNGFSAQWNGSTLFAGANLPAFGWTNMQYIVSASSASGTLVFSFNNTPGAFGLDDVTVQPLPAPVLYSASVSGGNIGFNWTALLNSSYQLQSSTTLTSNSWANVGSAITATNDVVHVSLPLNGSARFYRVLMQLP